MLTLLLALAPAQAQSVSDIEVIVQGAAGQTASISDEFGADLAFGDFNGDGYQDLVVGAHGEDVAGVPQAGLVTVFYGGASGYTEIESFGQDVVSGAQQESRFGSVFAVGDFDDNGIDDLAIGVPRWDQNGFGASSGADAGRIVVMYGFYGYGLLSGTSALQADLFDQRDYGASGAQTGDHFGWSLAAGDFDRDGTDDLAIGVPYEDLTGAQNSGRVIVHFGTERVGLDTRFESFDANDVSGLSATAADRMAWSLAAGDFDDDGRDDLAIGLPYRAAGGQSQSGVVAIQYGTSSGLRDGSSELLTQTTFPWRANEVEDHFGWALAAGNIDGRSGDDLVVGIPDEDLANKDTGLVGVFYGSTSGLLPATNARAWEGKAWRGSSDKDLRFGSTLAVGDLDNDGRDDFVVGVNQADGWRGAVAVFYGRWDRDITDGDELLQPDLGLPSFPAQGFGESVALGDMDGDGRAELAVGSPWESVGGTNAGAVCRADVTP